MYHISSQLDVDKFRSDISRNSLVQVPGFLQHESACALFDFLKAQKEWNLCFNKLEMHEDISFLDYCNWDESQKSTLKGIVYSQAENDFQYFYKSIPVFDMCIQQAPSNNLFYKIFELVNSSKFLSVMREVVGDQSISFADVQATCFDSGNFLKEHDDSVAGKNRVAAYVLNLTPYWNLDWGGLLHFLIPEII